MRIHPPRQLALLALTALVACANNNGEQASTLASGSETTEALSSSGYSGISPTTRGEFCLDIGGNSSVNGTRVQIWHCNNSDAQKWKFDNGLIRASNNRCLNVIDGNTGNNVRLQIWSCHDGDKNMQFKIQGNSLRWAANNKCIDVVEGNFNDGTAVQMYDCFDNSPNQSWNLGNGAVPSGNSGSNDAATSANNGASGGMLDGFVAGAYRIPWNRWTPQNQAQGLVNNEQEAYVTDGSTIRYEGDTLVITAKSNYNGYGWKSGKLLAPVLSQQRGYIEASMNNPGAQGTWPAFWLMPNENNPTWPQGGEIDIMEQVNGQPTQHVSTHFGPSPSQTTDTHVWMDLPGMSYNYHRYGVAWDQSHCAFYVDGKKVPNSTVWFPGGSPFAQHLPNYTPILNLAIGGMWPGYAQDSIGDQVLRVKYVVQSVNTPSDF